MPYETKYVKGTWNAVCDICGFQYKASVMKVNWLNQLVCKTCYEPKHPQLEMPPQRRGEGMPGGVTRTEPDPEYRVQYYGPTWDQWSTAKWEDLTSPYSNLWENQKDQNTNSDLEDSL